MTLEEAKRVLPCPVKYGAYADERGRLGRTVPLFQIPGRGWVSEREFIRLALVVAVNHKHRGGKDV